MPTPVRTLPVALDREAFLKTLVCQLGRVLEDVVGLEQAEGLVSMVGQHIGQSILEAYRKELDGASVDRDVVADILLDLKTRIKGDFTLVSSSPRTLEYSASACPFAEEVVGHPALCMMTSNVFGTITAEVLGYARVELAKTIARGDGCCQVLVHLQMPDDDADDDGAFDAREYFGEPAL